MKVQPRFYLKHYSFLLLLTALSAACYWWGWHVSSSADGLPFSRSGALATAVLVGYLLWDYPSRLDAALESVRKLVDGAVNWTPASSAARTDLDDKVKVLFDATKRNMGAWYSLLLLMATLVWGLGDLLHTNLADSNLNTWQALARTASLNSR